MAKRIIKPEENNNIAIVAAIWKRHDITRHVLAYFNELKKEIVDRIFWGTAGDIEAYIINDDANRWYFHEEDWVGIRKEIMEIFG